ncbi:MAG TPA: acylphosphatase [Burkholderiales bacterium]|nr:acylphosphatase [Burkholderiales bacterium]
MGQPARVHVVLSGRVQGVAYRYFAEKRAASFGLTGWIRNLQDGRVEVLAEGDRVSLELFLAELRKGPRLALVEDFDVRWEDHTGEFKGFLIRFIDG